VTLARATTSSRPLRRRADKSNPHRSRKVGRDRETWVRFESQVPVISPLGERGHLSSRRPFDARASGPIFPHDAEHKLDSRAQRAVTERSKTLHRPALLHPRARPMGRRETKLTGDYSRWPSRSAPAPAGRSWWSSAPAVRPRRTRAFAAPGEAQPTDQDASTTRGCATGTTPGLTSIATPARRESPPIGHAVGERSY
jgi:hypothetical protein